MKRRTVLINTHTKKKAQQFNGRSLLNYSWNKKSKSTQSAYATAIPSSLAYYSITETQDGLHFWCQLTQTVPEKG